MSELKRSRKAAFPLRIPALGPERAEEDVTPLVFRLEFPGRPAATMDLSSALCVPLVRELAAMMRSLAGVGRRIASPGTAYCYVQVVRKMDTFFAGRSTSPGDVRLLEITPADLDAYEEWLYTTLPTKRTAYAFMLQSVTLLREIRDARPQKVSPALRDRLMFVGRRPQPPAGPPVDAYRPETAEALRTACRQGIRESVERLTVQADAFLAAGEDPQEGGWQHWENVLVHLDRNGPTSRTELLAHWRASGDRHLKDRCLDLHRALFPVPEDLLPLFTLFILLSGMEPECAIDLAADCLKNPTRGYVEIEYIKRRRHGQEWNRMRVRDGGAATPGGLLRLVMRLTLRARRHADEEDRQKLWIYLHTASVPQVRASSNFLSATFSQRFTARHGILGEDGEPLTLHYRRLRKTYKAEFYRLTRGQLPLLASGHSSEVAAAHYADIPALRPVHEAAVADGLTQALDDAVRLTVLAPQREAELVGDPQAAADELGVGEEAAGRLLAGEMDLWLSSCRDFFNSPFGAAGQACPVPFWSCLDCSNAVITSRKLPAVLAYLDHLEEQRAGMPAEAFALAHGRTRQRILTQILPAFPPSVITEARAIAESTRPLENLPPLLGGIGSRQ